MKIRLYKSERAAKSITVILLVIAILVAGIVSIHVWKLKTTLRAESERYLIEIATHVSTVVDERIENKFEELGRMSKMMAGNALDLEQNLKILQERLPYCNYEWMGVIGPDYVCQTTDRRTVDLSGIPVIQSILAGTVSRGVSDIGDDGKPEIFYAVAIQGSQGQAAGCLIAGSRAESMGEILKIDTFDAEGETGILDSEGNLVLNSYGQSVNFEERNFFKKYGTEGWADQKELKDARYKLSVGDWGFLHIQRPGEEKKTGIYYPLEESGLYVLTVVPDSILDQGSTGFVKDTVFASLILIFLFLTVISLLLLIQSKSKKYLKKLAFEDPITGGYNWARFEIEAKKRLQNKQAQYALVSLDIDNFKLINNIFGIEAGNKTLRYIYKVLLQHLKAEEIAARATADKFYILMDYASPEQVKERLEQFSKDLNSFNEKKENKYYFKCVTGVLVIDDPQLSMFILQDKVNGARKSKNKDFAAEFISIVFFSDREQRQLIMEKNIDNKMTGALKHKEFVIYLQPKYELRYNTVAGAEALVRWIDPERGMIAPEEFIPVFEKNGFIEKLDLYVFDQVCSCLQRWKESGYQPVPVSINLSRAHLKNEDFLDRFRTIFNKYTIPPQWIEIELTETMVLENMELLTYMINCFHEIGFSCSLDDFGSGYSSLNILKDVPVDVLKLDREFFSKTTGDAARSETVIAGILQLAKNLNMKTVAEGVESVEQVKMLRRLQCDMVQGFVFSRPVPVDAFEKMAFPEHACKE